MKHRAKLLAISLVITIGVLSGCATLPESVAKIPEIGGWTAIACSADGRSAVASEDTSLFVEPKGLVFSSRDGGGSWVFQRGAGSRNWISLAMSRDGNRILAGTCVKQVLGGFLSYDDLYISSDGGVTWTPHKIGGSRSWVSVAISGDGEHMAAVGDRWFGGSIFTSSDGGSSWVEQKSAGSRLWSSITESEDGSRLAACSMSELYFSNDGGSTWNKQPDLESGHFYHALSMSSDGSHIVAATGLSGSIFVSKDGGTNWAKANTGGTHYWASTAVSSDGRIMAACSGLHAGGVIGTVSALANNIYISVDEGKTWEVIKEFGQNNWASVSLSADGSRIFACAYNGGVNSISTSILY
jgi:photosystem II stability/assembly factor-like uncharacterized protein